MKRRRAAFTTCRTNPPNGRPRNRAGQGVPFGAAYYAFGLRLDDSSAFHLDRVEERHLRTKRGSDLLDGVIAFLRAHCLELLAAVVLVFDEALGKSSGADVVEQALHGLLHVRRDDARTGDV